MIEQICRLAAELDPEQILKLMTEANKFGDEVKEFEKKLNKRLDKMVKNGECTEHEARYKFFGEMNEYIENSAKKTAECLAEDNEDDDAEDESEDSDDVSETDDDEPDAEAHKEALDKLAKALRDSGIADVSFTVVGTAKRVK